MKKGGKVVQLSKQEDKVEGAVVPFSVVLTNAVYDTADDDESDFTVELPKFQMDADILGPDESGGFGMGWYFRFEHPGLFTLEASYQGIVEITGNGAIDMEEFGRETAFPALTEFSLLISALSRSLMGLPYILGPVELLDLADGLCDFDGEEPF